MIFDVAIIDAGGANFNSIQIALMRQKASSIVTSNSELIKNAKKVILPGVGSAKYAMERICKLGLYGVVRSLTQPVLGVCVGQQILCSFSEEGNTECLGLIPLKVRKLQNARIIPHMGWNNLNHLKDNPLISGIQRNEDFYFVHSYAPEVKDDYVVSSCFYGEEFAAVIKKDNFYGVQFHPEKSGSIGEKLLINFINMVV